MFGIITEKKLAGKLAMIEKRLESRVEGNLWTEIRDFLREEMLDVHHMFDEKIGREEFIDRIIDRINRKQLTKGKGS